MKRKKVKLTILAEPDAGFLQRVLLIFSRRGISLGKCSFEAPDPAEEFFCQLELEIAEDSLNKIIRQIENILAVKNVIVNIVESGNLPAYQYEVVREKDLNTIT